MSTFQIIMLTIAGTLLFVYVVVTLLIIHENNRDLKKMEERIRASRRKMAEAEEKKDEG